MKKRNPHTIPKILKLILQSMQQDLVPFVIDPEKNFSRNRSISFQDVILIILTLASHTLNKELYNYFSPLKKTVPSKSAFSQQRAKLKDSVFPHILSSLNEACPFLKKYKGLHLIAFDGSDVNVPADKRDCATFIPYNSKNGGYHQLHVNAAFHLDEQRYIDLLIQPRGEFNETSAACDMVDRNPLSGKSLYLADRGYDCFNLMAHILNRGDYFLFRAKEISSSVSPYHSLPLPECDEFDLDVTFHLARSKKPLYGKDPATCKVIRPKTRFDYLDVNDKKNIYILSFRLIKIKLDNGGFEYLLTNLPGKEFGLVAMKDLYHLRWQCETAFLFLKYGVCLNYFHSIKTERLYQEIYARMILFNFISLIISCADVPKKDTKYEYKISFSDAAYLCRDYLLGIQLWGYIHTELLRHLTPIRPDRKSPRKVRSQQLRSLQHRS